MALKSDLFKGALMLMPSMFTGGIGLFGFGRMFKGVMDLPGISVVALANHRTRKHALRKVEGDPSLSVESMFLNNLETQMKTPADLDGQDLNALFRGEGIEAKDEPPITIQFPEINPNPKTLIQFDLASKFDTVAKRIADIDPKTPIPASSTYSNFMTFGFGFDEDPLGEAKRVMNQRKIKTAKERMEHYNEWLNGLVSEEGTVAPLFPTLHPDKTTTITDFLIEDLSLPDRILEYEVYVNGKAIDASIWNEHQISPADTILICPIMGLVQKAREIENLILKEAWKVNNINAQKSVRVILRENPDFNENDFEWLYSYYERLITQLYKEADWTGKGPSPNIGPLKFLIDESLYILNHFNILENNDLDVRDLSKIIRWSNSEYYLNNLFSEMLNRGRFGIAIAQDILNSWFSGLYHAIKYSSINENAKKESIEMLNRLMVCAFNIFDGRKKNPIYSSIRMRFKLIRHLIYQEDNKRPKTERLFTGSSYKEFNEFIEYNPIWDKWDDDPQHKIKLESWEACGRTIVEKLTSAGYAQIIPKVEEIWSEIEAIIKDHSLVEAILDIYPEVPKKNLIRSLVNNPKTNLFKILCTQHAPKRKLGWILFNHPNYDLSKGTKSYLTNFFATNDINPQTINALRHRISTLDLDDFKEIDMEDYIDEKSLTEFKKYADRVILEFIKTHKISYYGVGKTYKTEYIRDLQHGAFYSLWKAIAYQKNDFFIGYQTVFETLGFKRDVARNMFTKFISRSKMLYDSYLKQIIGSLTNLIKNSEKGVKFDALNEAREKFIELYDGIIDAKIAFYDTRTGSYLYTLYKPDYDNKGYSFGFFKSSAYKSFSKVSMYLGCYGTDLLSGEPIIKGGHRHHIENSRSLALSDMIFAQHNYHPIYEDISKELPDGTKIKLNREDFNRLQEGLRKLYKIGLSKDASDIQNGQWITEDDFKAVFPETETFSFTYNGIDYDGISLLKMWKDIFTENLGFGEKLKEMNAKITTIRNAELNGKDQYMELLEVHAPWYYGMVEEAQKFIEKLTSPSIITNLRDPTKRQWGSFTILSYMGLDTRLLKHFRSIYWI